MSASIEELLIERDLKLKKFPGQKDNLALFCPKTNKVEYVDETNENIIAEGDGVPVSRVLKMGDTFIWYWNETDEINQVVKNIAEKYKLIKISPIITTKDSQLIYKIEAALMKEMNLDYIIHTGIPGELIYFIGLRNLSYVKKPIDGKKELDEIKEKIIP